MKRLTNMPTLRVNPQGTIPFVYKKETFFGLEGDSLATALFANGVRVYGRSLKYHRPRGLYSLDGECSNTMMEVNGIPNVRTETTQLTDRQRVREQNVKGSAQRDLMGIMDRFDWCMPAGFYYKTMHKPAKIWPLAMKVVRRAAGLGRLDPDLEVGGTYDELYPGADVCVVGGGPSGMCAALEAADQGLRVIILEARPWLGGFFDYRSAVSAQGQPLYQRGRDLTAQVRERANIRVFTRTSMVGAYTDNLITAFQQGGPKDGFEQRYIEIRAQSLVVATGCRERPLLFENNERPGVMQVGCAHRLAKTYGLLPGTQAVFSVGHDLGLEAALDLHDLGLGIQAVADCREEGQDPDLVQGLRERNIPFYPGWVAQEALGRPTVNGARISSIEGTVTREVACDVLVASAGLTPVTDPLSLIQSRFEFDQQTGYFLPVAYPAGVFPAGRLWGLDHAGSIEASGRLAGLQAASFCGRDCGQELEAAGQAMDALPGPGSGSKLVIAPVSGRKSFVCFDEDVSVKNIKQALAQGFDVPELIKRFSSAGTGPGQGGIPGHNLPLLVAKHKAEPFSSVRPTTVRPPLCPVPLVTYAGSTHEMTKRTPIHDIQVREGGVFRRAGVWKRARYFSPDLDVGPEVANVRTNVGMLDASTLGNFRIHGPDAEKALQRVYVGDMSRIRPGRIKYSAMCNHDGCVIDDGVVWQVGENDYMFTTSSGRAGATVEWIRYHTRYEDWDFHLVNLTDGIGVINLAGPKAREVLEKVTEADVSNQAFSFAQWMDFDLRIGVPVRAMRLGFVGELSYELHVPSSYMAAAWEELSRAGRDLGINPYGVEAQNILRMEKGHVILGQESEQRTNLLDLGLGFLWARNKDIAAVGEDALRQAESDPSRLKLVGIQMEKADHVPGDGCVIVDDRVIGYIGTIRHSATMGSVIGMALVQGPYSREGTRLAVYENECQGELQYATVTAMPFYDPQGKRMRM
ncbi:FAD-dependent oxidoreductase [Desulfovermiculus halophilus]|uniref:FAD-dependent oxidoreductase n=1 Tax=Desulfovermiculus halophilus TaxID=339722 RepID=UPI0004811AFA|nr:FAD-dependent oxidoreductase [Desulfovermiculus halophilus]